jgi:2-dehydropantoate 2-reductase
MMTEAQTVGERLGVRFRVPLERRIAGAAAVGHHKTSMLQDVEMGREIELDALVGAVIELGRIVGVPTPTTENIYALAALLATTLSTARSRAASN